MDKPKEDAANSGLVAGGAVEQSKDEKEDAFENQDPAPLQKLFMALKPFRESIQEFGNEIIQSVQHAVMQVASAVLNPFASAIQAVATQFGINSGPEGTQALPGGGGSPFSLDSFSSFFQNLLTAIGAGAATAWAGADTGLILSYASQLDAYNNSNDALSISGQGKATPKDSQALAAPSYVYFDPLP